jgi:2-(1,2-epoxy-1,2-dihydrophenyl)acetyl-CoA isomerase
VTEVDTAVPATERHGRVLRCVVTAGNGTLDFTAACQVTATLRTLDPDVGAVLLAGTGPHFCTGANVRELAASDAASVRGFADELHELVRALAEAPVPVVAAVPGWAAGAGMSLVLAVDVAVAGTSTRLRPAYPAIGLSPDGGLTWSLPRAVGPLRARHILLTDRVLSAGEALDLGLVAAVVPDDEVAEQARQLAERFAAGPVGALRATKRLLRESPDRTLAQQLDAEAASIAAAVAGPEGREGTAAFLERRAPRFPAPVRTADGTGRHHTGPNR